MSEIPKTVAVDFDGCICEYAFPACGEPNWAVVNALRKLVDKGWRIILFSSRTNHHWKMKEWRPKVREMLEYMYDTRIPYHQVWGVGFGAGCLASRPDPYAPPGEFQRRFADVGKPVAHVYLDDRAICPQEVDYAEWSLDEKCEDFAKWVEESHQRARENYERENEDVDGK